MREALHGRSSTLNVILQIKRILSTAKISLFHSYSRITYLTVSSPEIHPGNSVVWAAATVAILYLDLPALFRRCVIVGKANSNYNHRDTLGWPIEK